MAAKKQKRVLKDWVWNTLIVVTLIVAFYLLTGPAWFWVPVSRFMNRF